MKVGQSLTINQFAYPDWDFLDNVVPDLYFNLNCTLHKKLKLCGESYADEGEQATVSYEIGHTGNLDFKVEFDQELGKAWEA